MLAEGRLVNLGCATGHPSFVMSQQLLQPDAGAARPLEEQGHLQGRRLHAAEEAGRGSRAPAPGEDRREADDALEEAGRLPRRAGRRPVQGRPLPLLVTASGTKRPLAQSGLFPSVPQVSDSGHARTGADTADSFSAALSLSSPTTPPQVIPGPCRFTARNTKNNTKRPPLGTCAP